MYNSSDKEFDLHPSGCCYRVLKTKTQHIRPSLLPAAITVRLISYRNITERCTHLCFIWLYSKQDMYLALYLAWVVIFYFYKDNRNISISALILCFQYPFPFLKMYISVSVLNTEMWTHKQDSEAEQLKAISCLLGKSSKESGATGNQSVRAK